MITLLYEIETDEPDRTTRHFAIDWNGYEVLLITPADFDGQPGDVLEDVRLMDCTIIGSDRLEPIMQYQRIAISIEGPFSISEAAWNYLRAEGHPVACSDDARFKLNLIHRDDPLLVAAIGDLGSKVASGSGCRLQIVRVPEGVLWTIEKGYGYEWIAEVHRTWHGIV